MEQVFVKLDEVFKPQSNYHNYRKIKRPKPSIPFLAVHLRDLTYINDGNMTYMDGDSEGSVVINFEKMILTLESIQSINVGDKSQFSVMTTIRRTVPVSATTFMWLIWQMLITRKRNIR